MKDSKKTQQDSNEAEVATSLQGEMVKSDDSKFEELSLETLLRLFCGIDK